MVRCRPSMQDISGSNLARVIFLAFFFLFRCFILIYLGLYFYDKSITEF